MMEPFGPDWIVTENRHCLVHNSDPEQTAAATWSGRCVDGKAQGEGELVLRRHDGRVDRYVGEMRAGKCHGWGAMNYHGNGRYEGEWHGGKQHGQGTRTWPNGARYEGEWRDGEYHGQGVLLEFMGQRYEGEWCDGKRHGQGVLTTVSGRRLEGEWQRGRYRAWEQWYEQQDEHRRRVEARRTVWDLWFAAPTIVRELKQRLHGAQVRGQTPHARRIRSLEPRLPKEPQTHCGTMELLVARYQARRQNEDVTAGQVQRRAALLKFWPKSPREIPPLPGLRRTEDLKRTRYNLWQESSYPFSRNRLGQYQYNLRKATRPGYRRPLGSEIPTIRRSRYRSSLMFATRRGYRRISWDSYRYRRRTATPLHRAAGGKSVSAVQALIAAGADLEARALHSRTPLHVAVHSSIHSPSVPIAEVLIAAGANLDARELYGKTPLHVAAAYSDSPITVELLTDAGADPNAQDEYGMTPLHWAAFNGKTRDIVPILLAAGADPNARDNEGMTPLHRAVSTFGEVSDTVARMTAAGADFEARDERGMTPLAYIRSFRKDREIGRAPKRRG